MDLKKDFPIFDKHTGLVYLDNASTTHKPQFVVDGVSSFVSENYANIHRWQYDLSAQAEEVYMQSKKMAAKLIGCDMTEIVYHYNATACSNLIAQAICYSGKVGKNDTVVLWLRDHHATIVVRQQLQKIFGFTIRYIPLLDNDYRVDWDGLAAMIDPSVKVVACSHVSNVTGAIYDMQKIRTLIGPDTFFIVDGSQSVPHFAVDVVALGCDCFFWTPHKMMAYTGIGAMYLSRKYRDTLDPLCVWWWAIDDVTVEWCTLASWLSKWEAGTPNIIGAASLLASLQYRDWIGGYATLHRQEQKLLYKIADYIWLLPDGVRLVWPTVDQERIGIFSFALEENSLDVVDRLAGNNICVRSGGHCAHPLIHHFQWKQLLRVSTYLYNTVDDIDQFFAYFLWKKG